ncbi:hypothetical protein [Sediminibacillus dalangtanensis]|nr:hypothetical protein [Sediminibacillus dalangtanensis]
MTEVLKDAKRTEANHALIMSYTDSKKIISISHFADDFPYSA